MSDFLWEPTRGEIEDGRRRKVRLKALQYLAKLKENREREDA